MIRLSTTHTSCWFLKANHLKIKALLHNPLKWIFERIFFLWEVLFFSTLFCSNHLIDEAFWHPKKKSSPSIFFWQLIWTFWNLCIIALIIFGVGPSRFFLAVTHFEFLHAWVTTLYVAHYRQMSRKTPFKNFFFRGKAE